MENWANRKTLILGRSEMIGLVTPKEYTDCVEQVVRFDRDHIAGFNDRSA